MKNEIGKYMIQTFGTPQGKEVLAYLVRNYYMLRTEVSEKISAHDVIVDIMTKMKCTNQDVFKDIIVECL